MQTKPIGILDSGVGGLSVVRAIRRSLPQLDIVYYADTANFPYGEKSEATIRELVGKGIEKLQQAGCEIIILACNTASTVSLKDYQAAANGATIMGVTPLLDEAQAITKTGKIIVLATFATLASDYYQQIQSRLDDKLTIYTQACFDWVRLVESGDLENDSLITEQIKAFARHNIDTAVLGCTHFSFLAPTIRRIAPQMQIVEPGEKLTKELAAKLGDNTEGSGKISYLVTGNEAEFVTKAERLLAG